MQNRLIVFEGTDGCGKTTQMQLCYEWMQSLNLPVVTTREPGGTEIGKDLREILLNKSPYKIAELFLYLADRAQHVQEVIIPNLTEGKYVLCDRFIDSTLAYQGYGRDIDPNFIFELNNLATNGLKAGLTIWIDVDVEVGLRRKATHRNLDRIEKEDIDFHKRTRSMYSHRHNFLSSIIKKVDGNRKKRRRTSNYTGSFKTILNLVKSLVFWCINNSGSVNSLLNRFFLSFRNRASDKKLGF